jgi:hypothetical protein
MQRCTSIRAPVPGLLIVCAPGLFRAGTLLGGLTRDGLLAIIGVTLSNSAIPHCRADNRLRAGDNGKRMDSLYPWLASAVVSFYLSPLLSLVQTHTVHVRHQSAIVSPAFCDRMAEWCKHKGCVEDKAGTKEGRSAVITSAMRQ